MDSNGQENFENFDEQLDSLPVDRGAIDGEELAFADHVSGELEDLLDLREGQRVLLVLFVGDEQHRDGLQLSIFYHRLCEGGNQTVI